MTQHYISPESFREWIAAMKAAGMAKFDKNCASYIGISLNALNKYQNQGVVGSNARRTGLAMRAALAGIRPWPEK